MASAAALGAVGRGFESLYSDFYILLQKNLNMAYFYWDPSRIAFTIPFIDASVFWYGLFFAFGFFLAYFIIQPIFSRFFIHSQNLSSSEAKKAASFVTDHLCAYTVVGTIVGARLGQVLFYDFFYFLQHPLEIFYTRNGGLSSHGGVLGVMLALYLFSLKYKKQFPGLTFLRLLDFVAVPSALVACFIRLGNFMNQEIVGTPTTMPWGVIFGHAEDFSDPVPRHPVQLYEALIYLFTFFILFCLQKQQSADQKPGKIIGTLLVLIFGSRIFVEFWKNTQHSQLIDASLLQMGQILSIPFALLGCFLIWRARKNKMSIV